MSDKATVMARKCWEGLLLTNDLLQPCQAHVVTEGIAKMDTETWADHPQSMRSLADEFLMYFEVVKMVVQKELKYQKVRSQWVP